MKIWIDGKEANVPQRLGSSQVAYNLISSLENADQKNEYTILLPNTPDKDFPKEREGWKYKILRPSRLWTRFALPLALYATKERADLIFSPTHYIPRFSPVKRVVTIFDLSYLHFPESFTKKDLWQLTNWSKFSIINADHIITISRFSKRDIIKHYGVSKDKITVAYPGYNPDLFRILDDKEGIKKVKERYGIEDSYIIYIGTIQPRKNLIRLIEAFAKIENLQLVVAGKTKGSGRSGWMYEEIIDAPRKLNIENKVKFLGFVPTEDLPFLLNGAVAFVQPSLWEGFGMPVVDAMACGCPVIASNVSSLPEVTGKAGLLVDPYSVTQIEQAIRTIYADKKLRVKLSKEGLKQAKKFSWEKMAKEMLKVFETLR